MKLTSQEQLTSSVIMVQPIDFGYNEQTGIDNKFQNRPTNLNDKKIHTIVMKEFELSIKNLNDLGVETLLLKKEHTDKKLPDAVFPNNWFSTHSSGHLTIYPMKTQNRRDEVQIEPLKNVLTTSNYHVKSTIDLRTTLVKNNRKKQAEILEGTGSLVFHHPSNQVFAAISERCEEKALTRFCEQFNYQLTKFNTSSSQGFAIYHTNVLMSCGQDFAVITQQVIDQSNQKRVLENLSDTVNEVIVITEEQMSINFCGNILQLKDKNNQPIIAMSESAYSGFTRKQQQLLENHGSLAICKIPTIERIGGGSVRCMLAENFLQKS